MTFASGQNYLQSPSLSCICFSNPPKKTPQMSLLLGSFSDCPRNKLFYLASGMTLRACDTPACHLVLFKEYKLISLVSTHLKRKTKFRNASGNSGGESGPQ